MATKLKNLKIQKVDFVDEGANPDAYIRLFKRKEENDSVLTEEEEKKHIRIWKSLGSFLAKVAGMEQEEMDHAIKEIKKGEAVSFEERYQETRNRKIIDEIWDICYALQSSFASILNDTELDSTKVQTAMQESLEEFYAVVQESISQWSDGKEAHLIRKNEPISEIDLEQMKSARDRLNESIEKATAPSKERKQKIEHPKGEEANMGIKIDKSKLTSAELAFLESIEKRHGKEETGESGGLPVKTSVSELPIQPTKAEQSGTEDIYKGLHPTVKAELEELKKFREATEDKELHEIAKRYGIIGKKEEELVPILKNLKAAGGTAYHDMIAVLDQAVDTVEKSGIFSEIGKAGHGSSTGSAWAEAETKAVEIMKSKPELSKSQALDEVFLANPALAEQCEKEE